MSQEAVAPQDARPDAKPVYRRVAFDFPVEVLDGLDDVQRLTGLRTRAELFRNALRLYTWFARRQQEGFEVVLRKGSDEKIVELF